MSRYKEDTTFLCNFTKLSDFPNSLTCRLNSKFVVKEPTSPHVSLHYLVKCYCQKTSSNLKQLL